MRSCAHRHRPLVFPRIVAGCPIIAQFLPTFVFPSNNAGNVAKLLGDFVDKLVRQCIIFGAKSGNSVSRAQMLWPDVVLTQVGTRHGATNRVFDCHTNRARAGLPAIRKAR